MGIGSFIRKQFIDILQWVEEGDGVLAWRHPMQDMEIQYGGSLTVRDSQMAVFVNEGRIADVFGPGMYKLTTRTLPVLTALQHWDKGFESPFKSDVIFFSTRLQLGRRWGTAQPVTIRDSEFGMVRVRAHGVYSYKVADVERFYREIVGTRGSYTVEDLEEQLRNLVVATMADTLGNGGVPFLDLAANQAAMSQRMQDQLSPVFQRYGVALENFAVESASLPEELQKALDTRIAIGMSGNLDTYTRYQTAQAIPLAAKNEGGIAGVGAGLAAGAALGQAMSQSLSQQAPASPAAAGTAAPTDPVAKLQQLKRMLELELITAQEYDAAKAEILRNLAG
jgi:membrane protease subunit (stomatin/prohibitin family)